MERVLKNAPARITGVFGNGHLGVDLGYNGEDEVYAHSDGKVVECVTGRKQDITTKNMDTYGNYITLEHSNGYFTRYAHLSNVDVKLGDTVVKGQKIGDMGMSGRAFAKHLHFEVRKPGKLVTDPTPYLDKDLPNMPKKEENIEECTPEKPEKDSEKVMFKVGDKVVPIKLVDYNGTPLIQYDEYYTIIEPPVDDRAVLGARGQVWAAMNVNNIKLVD